MTPPRRLIERTALAMLRRLEPERAHALSLRALNIGAKLHLTPLPGPAVSPRLQVDLAGLPLSNPLGLAAGFDKNAEAITPLARAGFGFIEVGAVTPLPQPGNPRPRLFRLPRDGAVINRLGFNNQGMEAVATRLAHRPKNAVIGLNLGANKDSRNRIADYCAVLARCGADLDFATVNVSSPNTAGLRDLQDANALADLLRHVLDTRASLHRPIPIFLKIAPDLTPEAVAEIAAVALDCNIDAIVATNTTLSRDRLRGKHRGQNGGLSGAPLFEKSTRILAQFFDATKARIPLIGVGGIGSAAQAYIKIRAGASALQLYTAMIYQGLTLVPDILHGLDSLLEKDGFSSVSEAVGTSTKDWL